MSWCKRSLSSTPSPAADYMQIAQQPTTLETCADRAITTFEAALDVHPLAALRVALRVAVPA